jgi:hypothetical protein
MALASSGCLSVDAVKDLVLLRQDEPEVVYWKVTPSPVDEFWQAETVLPADSFSASKVVKVKDGAKWIKLSYTIELPSALIGDQLPGNNSILLDAEVTLQLRMPSNDIYWERNFTETDSRTFTIQGPQSGIWTLRIEARGYGTELGGGFRDTLRVVVDLYEPK